VPDTSLYRSPFEGHAPGLRPTRAGVIGVHLSAGHLVSVTLVSTWPAGIDALGAALGRALGVTVPQRTGRTQETPMGLLMRTGPEEFMLISDQAGDLTARLRPSIAAEIGSVTDLSHARCRIHIKGARCLDTLSKLFALDLREAAFPLGEIKLSGHHHVPCTLHRRGPAEFELYVFSTYAFDQLATLLDAALEFGVALTSID
jgi:heterotetrameric sarcosine oxidase gamma subunit